MDIYKKNINTDEMILLYLYNFISEISICKKILNYKKNSEHDETMKYYIDRWENIAGEHCFMKDNHTDKFSFIHDETNYIINADMKMESFYMTGISYQIIELIHALIKMRYVISIDIFKYKDKLYGILSSKIMDYMKPKKRKYIYYSKPF